MPPKGGTPLATKESGAPVNLRLQQQVDDVVNAVLSSARGRQERLCSVTVGLGEASGAEAFAAAVRRALTSFGVPRVEVLVRPGSGPAALLAVEYNP